MSTDDIRNSLHNMQEKKNDLFRQVIYKLDKDHF